MSHRPYLAPQQVIGPTGNSMAASITSLVTVLQQKSMFSYSFSWSGSSPTGSLAIQVSNDYALDSTGKVSNAGTWNTIYFSYGGSTVDSVSVSGSAGNAYIDIPQCSGFAVRAVYTASGGTGTLTGIFHGKVT